MLKHHFFYPEFRVTLFVIFITAINLIPYLGTPNVFAANQVTPTSSADNKTTDSVDKPEQAYIEEEISSDSEAIINLQNTIKSDKENLVQLKKQLKEQKILFNSLKKDLKQINVKLEEKKKALVAAQQANKSEQAASLQEQIEKIEQDYELYKKQTDITLETEKAAKQQIVVLENKIKKDSRELAIQKGEIQPQVAVQPETPKAGTTPSPEAKTTPSAITPLPAAAVMATEEQAKPTDEGIPARPETAAQIEARREAQSKAADAQVAEQAIVDSVERKQALEEQIQLEEKLLTTAKQSLANLTNALLVKEGELQELITTNASKAELKDVKETITNIKKFIDKTKDEIANRSGKLDTLNKQLQDREESQEKVVKEAEEKREQAEVARKKSIWLESPLHPQNILRWIVTRGPRVLFVFAAVIVLLMITRLSAHRIARVLVGRGRGKDEGRLNRANTLSVSFLSLARVFIILGGILLALQEAGVDIRTVLGGAAIIGLAIAFGAQNLMRDYFTGFMIMLEDQYELGDIVSIGNITGKVETVNMRTTVLRDLEGRVHFIPNGDIKQVTNRTYGWAQAVFDINVAFKEDVDQVMRILLDCANELRQDPDFSDHIIEEPVMLGVDRFGDAAVTIKFMLKTRPDKMWPVRRELLRRIKNRFDQEGIEIPIPHRVIYQQTESALT